ncbi:MAG: hypothetical protein GXO60_07500 [Epsilonproteobacteria bacterium]|nr:hypothetical protein [Campylobacterota bacterium]
MFKQIQLIIVAIFIMTGCANMVQNGATSTTVAQTFSPKKIGYIINIKPYPTHTHIGTTKLTNFVKEYRYDWKIPAYTQNELVKNLKRLAYVTPINLKKYGIVADDVNGLLKNVNGLWVVRSGKAEIYKELANKLGLSAVVVINEAPKTAINDCGILGCKEYKAQGYGLLTKGFLTTTDYYSATPFWVHIYKLKPKPTSLDPKIVKINGSKQMIKVAISKSHQMQPNKIGLKAYPKDFKNWTEEEFAPFRLPLVSYIDGMTKEISTVLLDAF